MTPRALLLASIRRLRDAGVPNPETDAALLLSGLTGRDPLALRTDMDSELSPSLVSAYEDLLGRREKREPLQYIQGCVSFCGLNFHTDNRALIPRPETALLVYWALEVLSSGALAPSPRILDLCCGSGCIGLSLKKLFPSSGVTLSDLSFPALDLARSNAMSLGVEASFLQGDLLAPAAGQTFDLIISNPPYIPSRECPGLQCEVLFEPVSALDGGADGLDFYRRLAVEIPSFLRDGGCLMLEAGIHEAGVIKDLLLSGGALNVEIRRDLNNVDRMLLAKY